MQRLCLACALLPLLAVACATPSTRAAHPENAVPVLWRDPAQPLATAVRPPQPPFRFVEEDLEGDSPKFVATDAAGAEWRVKLGPEAQTEILAGKLLAMTGYFAEPMYYVPRARIDGLRLARGREFTADGSTVVGAQFEARPPDVVRGQTWDWAHNPFTGTRELDGLRVLMVLINNYDARADNNRVLLTRRPDGVREARYVVTDPGASFGGYGGLGGTRTKNDPAGFAASRFVVDVEQGRVRFGYRTRPESWGLALFLVNPFYVRGELKKQRDMQDVPVEHARWIGQRLAAIPPSALRDLFEDAGYQPGVADAFVAAVRDRIRQLTDL